MSKSPTTTAESVGPVSLVQMRRAPAHPGEVFKKDFREPANIGQAEAARRMNMTPRRLNEIELGKRAVSPETAILLAAATNTSAEFWMTMQMRHDLWHAMQRAGKPKVKAIA